MQGAGKDQCQVGVLLLVEYIGVLGESFVAVGAYTYLIRVCQRHFAMTDLSAVAVFRKHFDACLENVAVAHVCPAVPEVVLLHAGMSAKRRRCCRELWSHSRNVPAKRCSSVWRVSPWHRHWLHNGWCCCKKVGRNQSASGNWGFLNSTLICPVMAS